MSTQVDPLRSTLDRLAVDPSARADRPYLESVLRRLGYSEVEIQTYLGTSPGMPGLSESSTAEPDAGERVIELEYTGPGLRDYQIVLPPDTTSFAVDAEGNPLDLGGDLTAGEEVLSSGPSMTEVDALMETTELSDFGDFTAGESEVGKMNVVEGDEGMVDFGDKPVEGGEDLVEFGETGAGGEELVEFGETGTKPAEPSVQMGEELVIFQENPVNFGYVTPLGAGGEEG
ncbi:MAG TPA: hypothetical protein VI796_01290, partial [Candidatus Thermoplasmatota archaeon]|nr:hypothetical protein [Candidatus Thermoplasmatota archaeon]